ncbi:MAG: hypothetical protein ACOH1O_13990 [Flavobacterium sp.]
MSRNIKMIWDFRGMDAQKIAEHHEIHLKEYILSNNLDCTITGFTSYGDMHSIAFMVIKEADMISVRDTLRPQRAEVYEM